jgi:hypothetical protein
VSALAVGLTTGVAGASGAQATVAQATVKPGASGAQAAGGAQTAVQIPTGVWVELWMPYITPTRPKCLDIQTNGVLYASIFPCHGSDRNGANQLWQFRDLGNGGYWIVSKYWAGQCLMAYLPTSVTVGPCGADGGTTWRVIPSAYDPGGFLLSNDYVGECLAPKSIPSGNGSAMVRTWGCYNPPFFNGDVQIQTWRLG